MDWHDTIGVLVFGFPLGMMGIGSRATPSMD